jgi:hypothetical protein
MGIAPSEAKKLTVWELAAVTDRWIEAHDIGDDRKLSPAEADEIWNWMQQKDPVPVSSTKSNGHG